MRSNPTTLIVNLKGARRYRVRLWLATKLIELACWLAMFKVEIKGADSA